MNRVLVRAAVQTEDVGDHRGGGSIDVGIAVVGANRLAQHLVVVELNAERLLDVTDGAAGPHVEVIRADLDHLQIVGPAGTAAQIFASAAVGAKRAAISLPESQWR